MSNYANAQELFETAFLSSLRPKPDLEVWQWADKYRVLPSKTSAEAGRWRTSRTPYLKEIMKELSYTNETKKVVFKKGAQVGAALSLDTKLPTPKGWTTMGHVNVGDTLYDENGHECSVTFKSEIFKDHRCYSVKFNDGTIVNCDAGHRWTLWDEKKYSTRKKVTIDTDEIFKTFKNRNRNRYCIDVSKSISTRESHLPIDPYLLGIWLGDGNRHTGILYLNKDDSVEILAKINRKVRVKDDSDNCVECLVDGFHKELRVNNFLKEKKIPTEYLRASKKQRIELLKGLMDTDGSISSNRCEYSSVDKDLYQGVYELLMSLGIKASVYETISKNGVHKKRVSPARPLWRISFTVFNKEIFNLERKKERHHKRGRISETVKRRIVNVTEIDSVYTQCIEVDSPTHLYLCSDSFIATHNTECGNNWIGYTIDYDPCTMMVVWPSLPDVKKNSKLRIKPLIDSTPQLKAKIGTGNKRDESNTAMFKDFDDGSLILTGANSASGLRSVPAKKSFLDELDGYPDDVEGEGDPVALVKKRSDTFSDSKMFLVSTPTLKGRSKIHKEWLLSDQRWYYVPCPHCKELQILGHEDHNKPLSVFNHLSYSTDKLEIDGETVEIVTDASLFCKKCGEEIQEHHKTWMMSEESGAKWVKHNERSEVAGFMLSGMYSPLGWFSWKGLCQNYVDHLNRGDKESLITFINTDLGEIYEDKGERPAEDKLYQRREDYEIGSVPNGVLFLTCAVDVQEDRLEAEVIGWGRRKERWSIERHIIVGSPKDEETWNDLETYITQTFHHHKGYEMSLSKVVVDSGYKAQEVYNFCHKFDPRRVIPIKGRAELTQILAAPKAVQVQENGKKIKKGVKLWLIGVNIVKSELYGDLQKDAPEDILEDYPAGFIHFPMYDMEYFLQLTAEEKMLVKNKKGFTVIEWHKKRERNETLDLHVYNRAAASMVGIDRFREQHWKKLEDQINVVKKLQRKENRLSKDTTKHKPKRKDTGFW